MDENSNILPPGEEGKTAIRIKLNQPASLYCPHMVRKFYFFPNTFIVATNHSAITVEYFMICQILLSQLLILQSFESPKMLNSSTVNTYLYLSHLYSLLIKILPHLLYICTFLMRHLGVSADIMTLCP